MLSLLTPDLLCEIYEDRVILRVQQRVLAEQKLSAEISLESAIESLIGQHNTAILWLGSLSFWLESSMAYHFALPWQAGITRPEELRRYGTAVAMRHFPAKPGHALHIGFISTQYAATSLAAAIDEELWQILCRQAKKWKLRNGGIYLQFQTLLAAIKAALPDDVLFCIRGSQSSVYASRQAGQWQQVWNLNNDDGMDKTQQLALVARLIGMDNCAPRYFLNTFPGSLSD